MGWVQAVVLKADEAGLELRLCCFVSGPGCLWSSWKGAGPLGSDRTVLRHDGHSCIELFGYRQIDVGAAKCGYMQSKW